MAGTASRADKTGQDEASQQWPAAANPRGLRGLGLLGRGLARLADYVMSWHRGWRDGQLLAGLDDRQLRDIGIDRAAVGRDEGSAFWRLREPGGRAQW